MKKKIETPKKYKNGLGLGKGAGNNMSAEGRARVGAATRARVTGVKLTKEQIAYRVSKNPAMQKGVRKSDKARANMSKAQKGHKQTPEHVAKRVVSLIGREKSPKERQALSKARKGMKFPQKWRNNISKAAKGRPGWKPTPEISAKRAKTRAKNKDKTSAALKESWSRLTPQQKQIRLQKMADGRKLAFAGAPLFKQNKLERKVEEYLEESFPKEWQFNNGDFKISGYYPDFVNVNGKKAVIEVFGDYWHRGEDPKIKIAIYKRVGYDCVVIWESEFKKEPQSLARLITKEFGISKGSKRRKPS